MPLIARLYNNTSKRLLEGSVDLANLKVMILDDNATFDATHTTLAGPAGAASVNEVYGNGWTQGGISLANVVVETFNTDDAKVVADNIAVEATGGAIGDAYKAVLYDDSHADKAPLQFMTFPAVINAGETTDFKVTWPANGIFKSNYVQPA